MRPYPWCKSTDGLGIAKIELFLANICNSIGFDISGIANAYPQDWVRYFLNWVCGFL